MSLCCRWHETRCGCDRSGRRRSWQAKLRTWAMTPYAHHIWNHPFRLIKPQERISARRIFRDIKLGLSAVELHAATWTGTIHSFIGPWSPAPISIHNSAICRSDKARLLFLKECEGFSRAPVCPWQPFGTSLSPSKVKFQTMLQEHVPWGYTRSSEHTVQNTGNILKANPYTHNPLIKL